MKSAAAPIQGLTLSDALAAVEAGGWNRVQFTVLNYRPTNQNPFIPGTLRTHFTHFEFGTKPGHFVQKKAWIQGKDRVDLAKSGGHVAEFSGAADCPYHFTLHHYPLRSVEHARRKILNERLQRWSEAEQARGWHSHYAGMAEDAHLIWDVTELHSAGSDLWHEHGLPILSGIMRRSRQVSAGPY